MKPWGCNQARIQLKLLCLSVLAAISCFNINIQGPVFRLSLGGGYFTGLLIDGPAMGSRTSFFLDYKYHVSNYNYK